MTTFLALLVACSGGDGKDETSDAGTSVSIDASTTVADADTRPVTPEVCNVICPPLVECGEYGSTEACLADCAVVLGDCSAQESDTITTCVELGDTSDCGALATCINTVACTEE